MKKFSLLGTFLLASILMLSACGKSDQKNNNNTQENDQSTDSVTNVSDESGGTINQGDGYGFDKFDLEIEVDGKDAIDVEYDVDKDVDASYQDQLTNIHLKDTEAIDKLDEFFMKLKLTKDTSGEDARDAILEWFGLDNYSKFELEVDFDDGNELNFQETK
ncbi:MULTISPECIES: YusW family protein [Sporosarcina]|uniref:YusW family protein n=1 Tax=Sporosarcina contaminans TaxID=633403 RepID=A0ABW3U0Y1_9BACL